VKQPTRTALKGQKNARASSGAMPLGRAGLAAWVRNLVHDARTFREDDPPLPPLTPTSLARLHAVVAGVVAALLALIQRWNTPAGVRLEKLAIDLARAAEDEEPERPAAPAPLGGGSGIEQINERVGQVAREINALLPRAMALAEEAGDLADTDAENGRALTLFAMAHGLRLLGAMPERDDDEADFFFVFANTAEQDPQERPRRPRAALIDAAERTLVGYYVCDGRPLPVVSAKELDRPLPPYPLPAWAAALKRAA
jgi:hypothetical protein